MDWSHYCIPPMQLKARFGDRVVPVFCDRPQNIWAMVSDAAARNPEGEALVLRNNLFVERSFSERILRRLSDAEMAVYRRPYLNPGEDRRPTLTFPRELPFDGKPDHTAEAVRAYSDWMASNELPKLFIDGDPGAIITGPIRKFCRSWINQEEVRVKGKHFLQEDSPLEISQAIANWLKGLP